MSFYKHLSDSLFNQSYDTKVGVLAGLHERGALGLDAPDEEGKTLIDHMIERQPLVVEVVAFLDSIGRSDIYATAKAGQYALMDRQLHWAGHKNTDSPATDQALARMIQSVDAGWWLGHDAAGADPGSGVVRQLCRPNHSHLSLAAIWQRGVATDARMGDPARTLAAAALERDSAFQAYIDAGADLNQPTDLSGNSSAMWRPLLMAHDNFLDKVKWCAQHNRIDPAIAADDVYLKEVRLARGNKSEMVKRLFAYPRWQEVYTHNRTPAWLYAVQQRGDIYEELIARKRKRPDFTQRDGQGRSLLFWALAKTPSQTGEQDAFRQLLEELPAEQYLPDAMGRGVMTQLVQRALLRGVVPEDLPKRMSLLAAVSENTLFEGLRELDFSRMSTQPMQGGDPRKILPLLGLHLLTDERGRHHLTAEQRGHILAGCLLCDTSMGAHKPDWLHFLEKHLSDVMALGVVWPQPNPDRIRERERNQFNMGEPLKTLAKELLTQWVVEWAHQQLDMNTPATAAQPSRPRL